MINTNDVIFDNVYEDECDRLDSILLEVAKEIKEDGGYSKEMVERIIDTWCLGVGIRIKEEWHES
jgi:hypothetical protein|tara:strand:+ start:1190 stop:1384 length:195 start_codon:yes stop_codon:yes gene_type:complete